VLGLVRGETIEEREVRVEMHNRVVGSSTTADDVYTIDAEVSLVPTGSSASGLLVAQHLQVVTQLVCSAAGFGV
jgi:hypothetical protein